MNIKELLKKNPQFDYLQRCLRYRKDKVFVETVRAIYRDPNLLYFISNGNCYPNINFYDIYIDYPSKGFFALFNQTLDALRYSERFCLTPVVTWSDRCLYKEDTPVNNSTNPFCYYFERTSQFDRNDLKQATRVLHYSDSQRAFDKEHQFHVASKTIVENQYYDRYIEENSRVYRKYIQVKKPVQDKISESIRDIGFQGNVLGVHVRATDFFNRYINHAVAVTCEEYIAAVKEALEECKFSRIFLATDDMNVVNKFQDIFGKRVIFFNDVFRSTDESAVHFSEGKRENHKYLLGFEVIRDMLLLSKCAGLIGSYSNVCLAAQIARKSTGDDYAYLKIIDKGFNSTGKTVYQDHFK